MKTTEFNLAMAGNKSKEYDNEEKNIAESLFNAIKPDLIKAIALELKEGSIEMIADSMDNNILFEIEYSLQPVTIEVLKILSGIIAFDYFNDIYDLLYEVINELHSRNIKVYRAGVYRNPVNHEEVKQGWYSCNKERIAMYAKDLIEDNIRFHKAEYTKTDKIRLRACFFCEEA